MRRVRLFDHTLDDADFGKVGEIMEYEAYVGELPRTMTVREYPNEAITVRIEFGIFLINIYFISRQ
jgi:hypothetical protein